MADDGIARRAAELTSTSASTRQSDLRVPPPPTAIGLNRNVLIAIGAIVAMAAFVALTYSSALQSPKSRLADSAAVVAPRPQRAAFLDVPPKITSVDSAREARRRDSVGARADSVLAWEEAQVEADQAAAGWRASRRAAHVAVGAAWGASRDAAYRKALIAPVMVPTKGETLRREDTAGGDHDSVTIDTRDRPYSWPSVGQPSAPEAGELARRERAAFLRTARGGDTVEASGNEGGVLEAGTVIPAELLTDVNSDLPGDLIAQVVRDVYDSRTERQLLIPKGSRLVGRYDDRVATGQRRLLVVWTRLVFEDGRTVTLPGLQGTDEQGAAGLVGSVDQHIGAQFGDALLLSLLGAGVELSQPRTGELGAPSVGAVAGGALGQELSNVAIELVRRHADVAPTITVPLGTRFEVYVNRVLEL